MDNKTFNATSSHFNSAQYLGEEEIVKYAQAMMENKVEELPYALLIHVEKQPIDRTRIIEYYMWLCEPQIRLKPDLSVIPD